MRLSKQTLFLPQNYLSSYFRQNTRQMFHSQIYRHFWKTFLNETRSKWWKRGKKAKDAVPKHISLLYSKCLCVCRSHLLAGEKPAWRQCKSDSVVLYSLLMMTGINPCTLLLKPCLSVTFKRETGWG